ncbi:flagellar export chaperone FliS [Effusibacillus consociatus]|uniref:Flagellar secretion chaperone FliS n=1 Tax=Effusibacillus consociatus TaxID=1117041 RepID=A0ABV9Q6J0_9BACL
MINHPFQKYQDQSVQTATPERLLLMLFEGAMRFCKEAIIGINKMDIQLANDKIIRVQNIINELIITLDRDKGGDIAENLLAIYNYINQRLVEANIKKDPIILEEVFDHVKSLYEAFREAAQSIRVQTGTSGTNA